MTTAVRRRILDRALVTLTGLATTGAHVWVLREQRPISEKDLPALFVSVESGSIRMRGTEPAQRSAELQIIALARQGADLDDVLEAVWREVELALYADRTLGGAIKYMAELSVGPRALDEVGGLVVVRQTLAVTCVWFAPFGQPDASS